MGKPHISVIVVSWNTRDLTLGCLQAIANGMTTPHELVVVDNASSDDSAGAVRKKFRSATIIESGENLGFAGGVNLGFEHSRADNILLINPDARPEPGAIDLLADYLAFTPEAAIVGPRLLNLDGSLQPSAHRFYSSAWSLLENALVARLWPWRHRRSPVLTLFSHDTSREVDWVSGACLLARREVFERVGPLDESFWMYGEEVDWQWRAHKAGFRTHFLPDAVVYHQGGAAARQHPGSLRDQEQEARLRLIAKHHGPTAVALYRAKASGARRLWSVFFPAGHARIDGNSDHPPRPTVPSGYNWHND